MMLTHWGRVMHIYMYIYASADAIIGLDNGLSPVQCQAIIWTNAGLLITGSLATEQISLEFQ